jgi:hypothetical protein
MAEGFREIESEIDRSRQRLGSNVQELERRVDAAVDWREQFRARPNSRRACAPWHQARLPVVPGRSVVKFGLDSLMAAEGRGRRLVGVPHPGPRQRTGRKLTHL